MPNFLILLLTETVYCISCLWCMYLCHAAGLRDIIGR